MADLKISQLTGATTPLAGTEEVPLVQSSSTKKVAVSNLTAGRAVSAASYTPTGTAIPTNGIYSPGANQLAIANNGVQTLLTNASNNIQIGSTTGATAKVFLYANNSVGDAAVNAAVYLRQDGTNHIQTWAGSGGNVRGYWEAAGDLVIDDTNIRFATAARGVNFTANTPAAGMTSQLLNWYEEGTWTPTQGGGLTVVGAFSSTGRYTRIGRQVTVSGTVTGATSVAVATAGIVTTNLPFTVVTAGHGNATNAAVNAFAAVICTTTNVTSASAITATGTITFSATYFV